MSSYTFRKYCWGGGGGEPIVCHLTTNLFLTPDSHAKLLIFDKIKTALNEMHNR